MPRSKATAKPSGKGKVMEPAKKNLASQKISRKSAPVTTGVKDQNKKKRSRAGVIALRQIKRYQKSTELLIARAPFQRRIRQVAEDFAKAHHDESANPDRNRGFRFQSQALSAIQEAVESSIISLYQDASLCSHHAKRVTLFDRDINLARRIRGDAF